jgi:hypothetical protein
MDQIRHLRFHPDPQERKNRKELASMFGVAPMFVGLIAPLPEDQPSIFLKPRMKEREKFREWRIVELRKKTQKKTKEWVKRFEREMNMGGGEAGLK